MKNSRKETSTITAKSENNSTQNKAGNNQSEARLKNFEKAAVNPDNNAFFAERSNPLCSKGDWFVFFKNKYLYKKTIFNKLKIVF